MLKYKYGYIYDGYKKVELLPNGTITIDGYGRIHESMTKEIIKIYLDKFYTKRLTNDKWLLIVRGNGYIVKGLTCKPARWEDIEEYLKGDEYTTDELPEL